MSNWTECQICHQIVDNAYIHLTSAHPNELAATALRPINDPVSAWIGDSINQNSSFVSFDQQSYSTYAEPYSTALSNEYEYLKIEPCDDQMLYNDSNQVSLAETDQYFSSSLIAERPVSSALLKEESVSDPHDDYEISELQSSYAQSFIAQNSPMKQEAETMEANLFVPTLSEKLEHSEMNQINSCCPAITVVPRAPRMTKSSKSTKSIPKKSIFSSIMKSRYKSKNRKLRIRRNKMLHLENPLVCALCGQVIQYRKRTEHGYEHLNQEDLFHCKLCPFMHKSSYFVVRKHVTQTHGSGFIHGTRLEEFRMEIQYLLDQCFPPPPKMVKCIKCDETMNRKKMYLHLLEKHIEKEPYICSICGRCFRIQPTCKAHLLREHNLPFGKEYVIRSASLERSNIEKLLAECFNTECTADQSIELTLSSEEIEDQDLKPTNCEISFFQANCSQTQAIGIKQEDLSHNEEMEEEIVENNYFVPAFSVKMESSEMNLTSSIIPAISIVPSCTTDSSSSVEFQSLPKKSILPSLLKIPLKRPRKTFHFHEKKHRKRNSTREPIDKSDKVCQLCGQVVQFLKQSEHVYEHLDQPDLYYCQVCPFQHKSSFVAIRNHAVEVHGDVLVRASRRKELRKEIAFTLDQCFPPPPKMLKCVKCDESMYRKNMYLHLLEKHIGQPYICAVCGLCFRIPKTCMTHLRKEHNLPFGKEYVIKSDSLERSNIEKLMIECFDIDIDIDTGSVPVEELPISEEFEDQDLKPTFKFNLSNVKEEC